MRVLKMALTGAVMLATAGCAGVDDNYLTPYGPGTPTALPNSPGRGVWSPPALTTNMVLGTGNMTLYAYVQPFPVEARPGAASLTPELPTAGERNAQEKELVVTGDSAKARMEKRLEADRR